MSYFSMFDRMFVPWIVLGCIAGELDAPGPWMSLVVEESIICLKWAMISRIADPCVLA